MPGNPEADPDQKEEPKKRESPGEEMACLDIAIGILGILLLIFPALTSFRGASLGFVGGGLALLVGLVLAIAGGFMGLGERRRQRHAGRAMKASGFMLTVTALVLLAASSNGLISWNFPVGAIFLTLGLFADLAAWRFRKQVSAGHAAA